MWWSTEQTADPVVTIWWELIVKPLVASGAARGLLSAEGLDPAHAVASWIEANRGALERACTLLSALDREATDPLAVIALVLRRLNQVL
jgi:hypothetical protein